MIRFVLLLVLALGLPSAVEAASFQVSYSDWLIQGSDVRLRVELPQVEARLTMAPALPLTQEGVAQYVLAHVGVRSAAGSCEALDQGADLGRIDPLAMTGGRYRFEIFFHCQAADGMALENSMLFDSEPAHLDFAHIESNGVRAEKLFAADHQTIAAADARSDGLLTFLKIGLEHVRHNWDHLIFLIGLLVLVRGRRDLLLFAGGLATGYVLSALLGFSGLVIPDVRAAEALSGVAILLLAVNAMTAQTNRPGPVAAAAFACMALIAIVPLLAGAGSAAIMLLGCGLFVAGYAFLADRCAGSDVLCAVPAVLFAFLDGLSFLPPTAGLDNVHTMLAGFDMGALLFQSAILLLLFGIVSVAGPFFAGQSRFALRNMATAALCAMGVFWLARDYWI